LISFEFSRISHAFLTAAHALCDIPVSLCLICAVFLKNGGFNLMLCSIHVFRPRGSPSTTCCNVRACVSTLGTAYTTRHTYHFSFSATQHPNTQHTQHTQHSKPRRSTANHLTTNTPNPYPLAVGGGVAGLIEAICRVFFGCRHQICVHSRMSRRGTPCR